LSQTVKPADGDRSLARAAGLVSALTLLSRVLGLVRDQVFATLFGAGLHADAFQVAFRIPNLLRDLFAEGALSAAFVPTYVRTLAEQGRDGAHRLASRLMSVVVTLLGSIALVGIVLAGLLVILLAPGYEGVPGKMELTVQLTRIMLPFLPLVSMAAIAMGMLNAEERFGAPALAPALFNVVTIVWAGVLWAAGLGPEQVVFGWAVGTLLGGAAQFLIQLPGLRRSGWRYHWEWAPKDPGIRRIATLMGPATLGLAAVQINIFVSSNFASYERGAVSWLQYAFRLLYLPIGIFGVAVGTVATVGLSRRAASGDTEGLRQTLRQALGMLAFLTIPATVGLFVLGVPIIRMLFERGQFHAADTQATAAALGFYALGLVAYTGVKVLAPAFYALGTPRVPLLGSALAVLTNLTVILCFHHRFGFRSIALGTSLGALVNVALLLGVFESRIGGLWGSGLVASTARMMLAALLMAPVAHLTRRGLEHALGVDHLSAKVASGLLPVAAGVLVYGLLSLLLRVGEVEALWARLRPCGPGTTA